MCGEQLTPMILAAVPRGSPPRVRGTAVCSSSTSTAARITPACAGNSFPGLFVQRRPGDHPRVCGEQTHGSMANFSGKGSPPRVRGTGVLDDMEKHVVRITPACAGNRRVCTSRKQHHGDHPRVCGEQLLPAGIVAYLLGSPPRVRGTGAMHAILYGKGGITPACAGNRDK